MRVALSELAKGIDEQSNVRVMSGWKLFFLLPRLPPQALGEGARAQEDFEARFHLFQMGHRQELLDATWFKWASCTAVRQALDGAPVAPDVGDSPCTDRPSEETVHSPTRVER